MRITAKVDYAVRAAIELVGADRGTPVKGDRISTAQDIPTKFLENILSELRRFYREGLAGKLSRIARAA